MSQAIYLASLSTGLPGLTPAQGTVMAEAGSVCLESEGHAQTASLRVEGAFDHDFLLHRLPVDEPMRRCYRFEPTATEKGACGVAILVIRELTGYTVTEEAARGEYCDYFLGRPGSFLFQDAALLEVSGIRHGAAADMRARVRIKEGQIGRSTEPLPGFVVVVEFRQLVARVTRR